MSDDEPGSVTFRPNVAVSLALKILILLLIFIFPFIIVSLLQDSMISLWGEPSPMNPLYVLLLGILIFWFIIGAAIIIPRTKRLIDTRYGT